MQKTLYPYLPEPMRNPETMEWMLSQPQYRQQMEQMMNQVDIDKCLWHLPEADLEVLFPQMQGSAGMPMGGMPDLNSPDVKAQFDQLGMSPQEVCAFVHNFKLYVNEISHVIAVLLGSQISCAKLD